MSTPLDAQIAAIERRVKIQRAIKNLGLAPLPDLTEDAQNEIKTLEDVVISLKHYDKLLRSMS